MMAATTTVQTPGPDGDLFGPLPAQVAAQLEFHGVLSCPPVVVPHPNDHGHAGWDVVLDLAVPGRTGHHITAHVPFPHAARDRAVQLAERLRPGQTITVASSIAATRVVLPAARLIPNP